MSILTRLTHSRAILAFGTALAFFMSVRVETSIANSFPTEEVEDQGPEVESEAAGRPNPDLNRRRQRPNILFFIMDDVGIDQMQIFGYGGETPPRTPNIDAIARAGVRFRNAWAMPECSPSRAMFFEGRYPLRTNVFNAILSLDLANSQVSPYEITTPKLLKRRGYASGLFGKFHLTSGPLQSDNNPYGYTAVPALGWDFFAGYLDGAPFPIDMTAGGVGVGMPVCVGGSNPGTACPNGNECLGGGICNPGPYGCGFVPNATDDPQNGADTGACYFADSRPCIELSRSLEQSTPGRACLDQGGIFVPNQSCQSSPPSGLNFNNQNAYYVSQLVINQKDGSVEVVPFTDPRARIYRSIIESDLAINWITQRRPHRPWMATVSYSSAHTPYQQPPTALLPLASVDTNGFNCTAEGQLRVLSNQMIESLDKELGRVMVEVGLATRKPNGELDYHPETTNTMVIIIGDNGTFAPGVKAPFDPNHSKATAYQTGVWVPLIVAGPLVNSPDREVTSMVNIADLFQLFGEVAGVDVRRAVPKSHVLDSVSMLPYLTNPNQGSIRQSNFTQTANNIKATGVVISPCVVTAVNTCVQLFPQQQLCESEGGVWYGPNGAAGAQGLASCCAVNQYLLALEPPQPPADLLPDSQLAIRNDQFKLVQLQQPNCDTGQDDTVTEFYEIDENVPPKIDRPDGPLANNLLTQGLTPEQQQNFDALSAELQIVLNSEIPCPGDGNLDKRVDGKDLADWRYYRALSGGQSSWYDLNFDGLTNDADRAIIEQNFGKNCLRQK